jgi:hypothetical protein
MSNEKDIKDAETYGFSIDPCTIQYAQILGGDNCSMVSCDHYDSKITLCAKKCIGFRTKIGYESMLKPTLNPSQKDNNDPVNHPSHYTKGKYEVIDVLQDWFNDDPLIWQVGKYIARYKYKGVPVQDLKKAKFYLERKIKQLEEEKV